MLTKANRTAQEVKVATTEPDNWSWILGTHMVEG